MNYDELLAKIDSLSCCSGAHELALRAVVELHKPSGIFCRGCGFNEEYMEPAQLLPCPTIQAIEKELK